MTKTKKMVFISVLASLGSIIGLFELMMPLPVAVPGMRLGLSNIVVLVTLVVFGYKEGIYVALLKSIILMLLSGNVSSFLFSFTGAFLSSMAMSLAINTSHKFMSLIGVSIIGSSFHNTGQVLVAYIILKNKMIFSYLPILLFIGLFTGFFVGLSSFYVAKKLDTRVPVKHGEWIS